MSSIKVNPIRLREITPYVDVVIDGVAWKAIEPLPGVGWELAKKAPPKERRFLTTTEYEELKSAGRVSLVSEVHSFASLAALTPLQRKRAFIRLFWMEVIDEALSEGEIEKLTRRTAKKLIAEKADLIADRWKQHRDESDFDHGKTRRKRNFGSLGEKAPESGDVDRDRLLPCAETLIAHYLAWVAAKRDFWRLVPHAETHCKGGKEIDPRTWHQIKIHVPKYASEKQPTLKSICERVNIEIAGLNATLGDDNAIPLATTYGVAKAIDELPAAVVLGGRLGKKQMRQQLAHVGTGPKYKRVGEMTLHDCWTVHAFTLIPENARHLFSEKELHTRVTLAVVQDAATGALVAIKFGVTESAELVNSALRMAGEDKTAIAHAAGCTSDWAMRVGIEEVKSDSGGAYRSETFMGSVYSVADRLTFTAAGRAHLRGQIERTFQKMDVDFIRRVTGRTGSSVKDRPRDEQDPAKRASLFIDQFMKLLIRYVVDVLHYRAPARGGLSPARKFEAITSRMQCKAPPTDDEVRVAFGILLGRTLTRAGIQFMNILYHSAWIDMVLAEAKAVRGSKPKSLPVQIRVDEKNLGRISVLIGTDWTTIPGPRELEGVSLSEWLSRQNELARRYGEQARLDFAQFVAPALLDIERETKRAEEYFHLENVHWTAAMMDQIENELRVFVLYDRAPDGDERGLTEDSSLLGSVHTRTIQQSLPLSAAASLASPGDMPPPAPVVGPVQAAEPSEPAVLVRKRTRRNN